MCPDNMNWHVEPQMCPANMYWHLALFHIIQNVVVDLGLATLVVIVVVFVVFTSCRRR